MTGKPKKVSRQAKHRQDLLDAGGAYVSIELDAVAVSNMEHVIDRDGLKSKKQAIEESLAMNAAMGGKKR